MKYLFLFVVGLTLFSCKSNNPVENKSTLSKVKVYGLDQRDCFGCCGCGGMMFNFDLTKDVYQDTFYLSTDIVPNKILTDSTVYPLIAMIEYKFVKDTCSVDCNIPKLKITRIEK